MEITSEVFGAYLKCPTKCWLRFSGEPFSGSTYSQWVKTQSESYCADKLTQLAETTPKGELAASPFIADILAATWRYATEITVRVETNACTLKSELHALERPPATTKAEQAGIVPLRFVFTNKLSKDESMLLAFDALILSKSLRQEIKAGKIIHGDHGDTTRVNISFFLDDIQKRIQKIIALLSSSSPPELVLNRHCTECEFQHRCRQKATEADDLSLLSGMSDKERARHRSKGIFTVTQLSYTFRPRRTPKRAKNPAKPHHFALQALAIREKCVYIHGTPTIPECTCQIFLDIEGLPDREFYYLIGALVVFEDHQSFHSFWADTKSDSEGIFRQFADLTDQFQDYRVFHYGDYDSTAIKRIAASMPIEAQERFSRILQRSVNVLSLIFPHVYFPTYSNQLKEIAKYLVFCPSVPVATGLDSISWRTKWEVSHDVATRDLLLTYNQDDCLALQRLADFLSSLPRIDDSQDSDKGGIQFVEHIKQEDQGSNVGRFGKKPFAFNEYSEITERAYFDYQRNKIYVRTNANFKKIQSRARRITKKQSNIHPNKIVNLRAVTCPFCQNRGSVIRDLDNYHSKDQLDLRISRGGIKRWVIHYRTPFHRCIDCNRAFVPRTFKQVSRFGHGLISWGMDQHIGNRITFENLEKTVKNYFSLPVTYASFHMLKTYAADYYASTYNAIRKKLIQGPMIHVDETKIDLQKGGGYVWVMTNMEEVFYLYRNGREADFLHELLAGFNGVLISDFYTGYDSLPCPQQKCLIHLIRDINEDILKYPFDQELRNLAEPFGKLLRSIIETVDRVGLKSSHLSKHRSAVNLFIGALEAKSLRSEIAEKYVKRIVKYRSKLFTFLDFDGVPWNNNNAEHAIKPFAKYRRLTNGRVTEPGLKSYLVLLSLYQTCKYKELQFLDFLLSKERNIDNFSSRR